jgi:hypothetical protein
LAGDNGITKEMGKKTVVPWAGCARQFAPDLFRNRIQTARLLGKQTITRSISSSGTGERVAVLVRGFAKPYLQARRVAELPSCNHRLDYGPKIRIAKATEVLILLSQMLRHVAHPHRRALGGQVPKYFASNIVPNLSGHCSFNIL